MSAEVCRGVDIGHRTVTDLKPGSLGSADQTEASTRVWDARRAVTDATFIERVREATQVPTPQVHARGQPHALSSSSSSSS